MKDEAEAPAELAAETVADSPAARSEERTTSAHPSARGTSAVHSATAMRALKAEALHRALGISYFGLADDRGFSWFMCVSAMIGYGALALLVSFGALPDPALFPARDAPVALRLVAIGTALAVFAVMFWQGRLSRNATHEAV